MLAWLSITHLWISLQNVIIYLCLIFNFLIYFGLVNINLRENVNYNTHVKPKKRSENIVSKKVWLINCSWYVYTIFSFYSLHVLSKHFFHPFKGMVSRLGTHISYYASPSPLFMKLYKKTCHWYLNDAMTYRAILWSGIKSWHRFYSTCLVLTYSCKFNRKIK